MNAEYRQMLRDQAQKHLSEGSFRSQVLGYTLQILADGDAPPGGQSSPVTGADTRSPSRPASQVRKPAEVDMPNHEPKPASLDKSITSHLDTWELMTERLRIARDKNECMHAKSVLESVCTSLEEKVDAQLHNEERTIFKKVKDSNPKLADQIQAEHASLRMGFREVRSLMQDLETELLRGNLNGEARTLGSACEELAVQLRRHIRRSSLLAGSLGQAAKAYS